ncbi:MAG: delta-60 repeat domain-containing protein [Actinomycetota bacterium]
MNRAGKFSMDKSSAPIVVIALAVLLIQPYGARASVLEGSPDSAFGSGGIVTTIVGSNWSLANAMALQTDGKIVVAGSSSGDSYQAFTLVRYNSNGSLDAAFGSGGIVTTAIGSSVSQANAVALQPDGKIVVAGSSYADSAEVFTLVRYNPGGSLDATFGSGGIVTTAIGPRASQANAIVVQTDGKIVLAGFSYDAYGFAVFTVARYKPDGSLDVTFGSGGIVKTAGISQADAMALQIDGKIVVAGYNYEAFALVRYTSSGSLDTTFGNGGTVITAVGPSWSWASAVALQSDGKIVVVGSSSAASAPGSPGVFTLIRYNPNGMLDTTFGSGGIVTTAVGSGASRAFAVVLQPHGKIVAAGDSSNGLHRLFTVLRYNPNGSLDAKFGSGGIVTTGVGSQDSMAAAVALQRDGKIVAAGSAFAIGREFALARYIGDATPPSGARMIGVPRYSTALTPTFGWTASDDNTGVASFDVIDHYAGYNSSSYLSWRTFRAGTTWTHGTFSGAPGYTYCLEVRGRDFAGNIGAYSSPACVAFPVDDRTLAVHGTWTSGTNSAYYRGTYRVSTTYGAYLTLPIVYRHLAIVVTTCATCGTFRVYLGSTLLKTVSTYATASHYKVVIEVSVVSPARSGTLKIVQVSTGKRVIIDGVAVSLN